MQNPQQYTIREQLRKLLIQQNSTLSIEQPLVVSNSSRNAHLYYDDQLRSTRPLLSSYATAINSTANVTPTNVYGIAEKNSHEFLEKIQPKQFCGFDASLQQRIKITQCYTNIDPLLCCSCVEFYSLMSMSCDSSTDDNSDIFMRYRNKLPIISLNVSRLVWTFHTFRHRLAENENYDEAKIMKICIDFYLATDYKHLAKNENLPNLNFSNYLHKLRTNGYLDYAMSLALANSLDVDFISSRLFRESAERTLIGGNSNRDEDDADHGCETSRIVELMSEAITASDDTIADNSQYFIGQQVGQEIDNITHYRYRLKNQRYYGFKYRLNKRNSIRRGVLTVIENGAEWYVKVSNDSIIFQK